MTTADLHTLAGAYALDALDDIERAAFARHLAECEACAAEVAEFGEATMGVSVLVDVVPSVALRGRVLAEIGRTRQVAPGRPAASVRVGRPGRRWRRIAAGAVAASVIAVGAGAIAWTVSERRVADGRAQIAALEAERERMYEVVQRARRAR